MVLLLFLGQDILFSDNSKIVPFLIQHDISHIVLLPSMLRNLISIKDFSRVRLSICSMGEMLDDQLIERMIALENSAGRKTFECMLNGYGVSEAGISNSASTDLSNIGKPRPGVRYGLIAEEKNS